MRRTRMRLRTAAKGPLAMNELRAELGRGMAQLRKEFEKARAAIAKFRAQGSDAFDELYELVGRVLASEPPLYLGGGYRTVEAFVAGELPGETLRNVQRNVLVARCFSPADEARHGITFLEEAANYARELAGANEPPPAIDLDKLVVRFRGKGGDIRKKARACTIDDVRKARRLLRSGTSKAKASPAEAALRAALGKSKALAQIAVRAGGETARFGPVPLDAIAAFGKALAGVKLPRTESAANRPRRSPR